jgi:hypothetical protein
MERQQKLCTEVVFRAGSAFAKPDIYEVLEERSVKCAIRILSNETPERNIAELLTRPVGRPSHKPVLWYKKRPTARAVARVYNKRGKHGTVDQGRQASGKNDAAPVGEVVENEPFPGFRFPKVGGNWT